MKISDWENRKISIKAGCTICKTCEFLAPALFEVPEAALTSMTLKDRISSEAELPDLLEAIRACPVHVIKFRHETA